MTTPDGMSRRSFFAALPAATPRRERANKRAHHDGQRIFHGPMGIPDYVLDSVSRAMPYRTTHRHPVLRVARDGITYVFRSAPAPEMVGEIWRTLEGQYRVHVWSCATPDRPIRAALDRIDQDRAVRTPTPQPQLVSDEYSQYFAIMPPLSLEALDE